MKGFYTVNTPDNPIAATLTNTRKAEYEIFLTHRPPIDADFDDAVTTLASLSGRSPYAVKAIIFALYRLDELPQLKALHEHLFHLDFPRLAAIDQVLDKLGPDPHPDTLERIDTALTRYLTPRTPHRILPSVANLRRKVNALVTAEDPDITPEKKTPPPPEYGVIPLPRGRCQIYAEFDTPDAILIDTTIEATAKHHSISTAEAFKLLITQNATPPRTTLHLYRAADIPDTPVYIPGFGWVDPTTGDTLAQRAQRTTDLDHDARTVSPRYTTPDAIKRAVEARDGTCRYPHCSRAAHTCQKDHCVDFADGGPTAAFNLVSLCQHHHNIKTDGRISYIIDPATDDVVWLFDDGHYERTEAHGPTAAQNRNWAQSIAQAITSRRTRAREEATRVDDTEQAEMQEKPTNLDLTEPPPF